MANRKRPPRVSVWCDSCVCEASGEEMTVERLKARLVKDGWLQTATGFYCGRCVKNGYHVPDPPPATAVKTRKKRT